MKSSQVSMSHECISSANMTYLKFSLNVLQRLDSIIDVRAGEEL
jgi:hypothetical protein